MGHKEEAILFFVC